MLKKIIVSLAILCIAAGGCATAPEKPEAKAVLSAEVQEAVAVMKAKDPSIERFFETSYAYAVFPKVFKGAFIVGGAHGKGEVYEQGTMVGYSSLSQATIGLSVGGEYFREILFFKEKPDLDVFKQEEYTFSAQATAVALSAGAAAKADYKSGMAVFMATDTGLMVDASIGGQKFKYVQKVD